MAENTISLDTLQSENYTAENRLNKEHRRLVYKMFKYIREFPISEYDVEMVKKDIIGMAAEAEQRNSTLNEAIGEDCKNFCDELVLAIAGAKMPKGRKYLRVSGIYYEFLGWFQCLSVLFGIAGIVILWLSTGKAGEFEKEFGNVFLNLAGLVFAAAGSYLMITAGRVAKKYCGDREKADLCKKWGLIMLGLTIVEYVIEFTVIKIRGESIGLWPGAAGFLLTWLFLIFNFFWIWLYLAGAKRNKMS